MVCSVGMARAHDVAHGVVVGAAGIGVGYGEGNRGAGGYSVEKAGEHGERVGLATRGGACGSRAGAASVELGLHGGKVDAQACGHAVEHASYGRSVAFAERGQPENVPECVHFTRSVTVAPTYDMRSAGAMASCRPRTPALT